MALKRSSEVFRPFLFGPDEQIELNNYWPVLFRSEKNTTRFYGELD